MPMHSTVGERIDQDQYWTSWKFASQSAMQLHRQHGAVVAQTHIHVRILAPTTATTQHFVSAHDGDYYNSHVVVYCTRLWKLFTAIDALLDDSCTSFKLFWYSTQCSLPLTKLPITIVLISTMTTIHFSQQLWHPDVTSHTNCISHS